MTEKDNRECPLPVCEEKFNQILELIRGIDGNGGIVKQIEKVDSKLEGFKNNYMVAITMAFTSLVMALVTFYLNRR